MSWLGVDIDPDEMQIQHGEVVCTDDERLNCRIYTTEAKPYYDDACDVDEA